MPAAGDDFRRDCRGGEALDRILHSKPVAVPGAFSQGQSSQPVALEVKDWSPWETPGRQWLAGGRRSSLLESAQQATLTSVATPAFQRQSNSLAASAGTGRPQPLYLL